jgi:hypothetical protein
MNPLKLSIDFDEKLLVGALHLSKEMFIILIVKNIHAHPAAIINNVRRFILSLYDLSEFTRDFYIETFCTIVQLIIVLVHTGGRPVNVF